MSNQFFLQSTPRETQAVCEEKPSSAPSLELSHIYNVIVFPPQTVGFVLVYSFSSASKSNDDHSLAREPLKRSIMRGIVDLGILQLFTDPESKLHFRCVTLSTPPPPPLLLPLELWLGTENQALLPLGGVLSKHPLSWFLLG